jgi:hypothetical protein
MSLTDERVAALFASPLGCAFLFMADKIGLTPSQIAEPAISLSLGAYATNEVEVWRVNYHRVSSELLRRGPQHAHLATSILEEPATAWWFSPPNRDHQVCVPPDGNPPDPTRMITSDKPPSDHERYAQKALGAIHTSTLVQGTLLPTTSSMFEALDYGTCDIVVKYPAPPFATWHLKVDASARVFEIDGPLAWHDLCTRYPADAGHRIRPRVELATGPSTPDFVGDRRRLVPDWSAVAADWDGVHLTFGGLLTAEQVPVESAAGWTYHWGWHAEQTMWLRWVFTAIERMPDHQPGSLFKGQPPLELFFR